MMLQTPSSSPLMSPENLSLPSSPILSATTDLASGNLADVDEVDSTSRSPLWISLLASVQSKGALTAEAIGNIASENNPRPLRSQMPDTAEYWLDSSGSLFVMKFPAQLDTSGQYSRIGSYFNLPSTGCSLLLEKLDASSLRKLKAQFELCPLGFGCKGDLEFPANAIQCSCSALETLFALVTEVEDSRNASVDVAKHASTTPFWRTYDTEDHYVLIIHSDPLIKDLPDLKAMSGPRFSRAEIGKSSILLSPSKVKARATSQVGSSSGVQGGRKAGGQWKISNLKDPQGRYAGLLNSHPALHDASVISPNVRDGKGVLIPPGEYASKLHDSDIVEVEIILKLWNIKANKSGNDSFARDANGSQVYQLVLKNMTLLPAERYTQPAMIKAPDFKGKQKASCEAQGQSPTKKGTKKAVAGGSKSAAQDMDVL
ncbi:hypothetical protein BDN67DRAFT_982265 [Paxillus ammoniavirescens]|nr:hypothetical protein BDN67DRAFT_982265 [Paxillus ammoniavirescens]